MTPDNIRLPERYTDGGVEIHVHFRRIDSEGKSRNFCIIFEGKNSIERNVLEFDRLIGPCDYNITGCSGKRPKTGMSK